MSQKRSISHGRAKLSRRESVSLGLILPGLVHLAVHREPVDRRGVTAGKVRSHSVRPEGWFDDGSEFRAERRVGRVRDEGRGAPLPGEVAGSDRKAVLPHDRPRVAD